MISDLSIGCDPYRVQSNDRKCFFVSYMQNGTNHIEFFELRFMAEIVYQRLKQQKPYVMHRTKKPPKTA